MSNYYDTCFRALDKGLERFEHEGCTWNHYHGIGTAESAAARLWGKKQGRQNVPHVANKVTSDGDCRASHVVIDESTALL